MTHGLCGKEGAMVFKRVLKGIGRLMLTTAVMCGVGLFLCSSEVKAAPSVTLSKVEDEGEHKGDFKVTLTLDNVSGVTGSDIKVKLFKSSKMLYEATVTKPTETSCDYYISATDFINSSVSGSETVKENWNTLLGSSDNETSITIDKVDVYQENGATIIASNNCNVLSNTIHKVVVTRDDTTGVAFKPDFTDKSLYSIGGKNRQYGYEGESYTITPAMDGFDTNQYYDLVKETNSYVRDSADPKWKLAGNINGTISKNQSENEFKVAYLPIIKKINIVSATLGNLSSAKDRLEIVTSGTNSVNSTITYEIGELGADKEASKPALKDYFFTAGVSFSPSTLGTFGADITDIDAGKCKVTTSLINTSTSGSGTVTISAKLGGESNIIDVASVNLPVSVGVNVDGINLQNQSGSIIAGGTKEFSNFISSISPAGASQDLLAYNFNVTEEGSEQYLEKVEFDSSTNKLTIKAKEGVSGKTATVKITLTSGTKNFDNTFKVNIVSFDKAKTIDSIKNSNKNYITYNKDKGYSLDIKQLIIDNAKDSSGNSITIDKNQITEVKVGSTSCSEGTWKPSEAALNQKVSCKINGVKIEESDGLKVSAYPMPTATYSSSNRTLSVKIPTKVATAYSDDNNIRQSKGFKLILEDSSGNTLYEYTDSKYQNVLSSSSESTVTYTVTAADIEGMITSAASNGKFSADTTSVKFKVIPMGYKQSSTSDETIKAKDEIAGKTDAVTVYKVSASGTNFSSTAAYGLDGQTVSITATPNSGYSFKQWSDGNTSNPRQVKVSASGTRSFQAVAGDRVANSTGAGGTDNSELYDDVPKTAESNSAIWLIVFMVFAVMGTTYALYLQLKAANSKHDR